MAEVMKKIEIMNNFTLDNIPDLDDCVLAALELFIQTKVPEMKIHYKRPLVVGSGNAAATGKIIFEKKDAVFADESNIEKKLGIEAIDGVVIISASGGKHAPIIAQKVKKLNKPITLITNNIDAEAKDFVDQTYIFPKNREPYTYNTSTYMGMILGYTKENPQEILQFIKENIDGLDFSQLRKYDKFFLIVPEEFEGIIRLLNVKFIELFGRKLARDIETYEYMKHAVTVVPSKELFISFGKQNEQWGDNLFVPLPNNVDYAVMMAIAYYVIGKIQKEHKPYFKNNLENYMEIISKIFGKQMNPIVD